MLSHKLVFNESQNFTSGRWILAPPTIPINHYFSPRNQQNRKKTEVLCCYSMLMYSQRKPALNTLIFFKVTDQDHHPNSVKSREALHERCQESSSNTNGEIWKMNPKLPKRNRPQNWQKSNYELFNCNNFNIRYWSWYYRGCWHQTCPPIATR